MAKVYKLSLEWESGEQTSFRKWMLAFSTASSGSWSEYNLMDLNGLIIINCSPRLPVFQYVVHALYMLLEFLELHIYIWTSLVQHFPLFYFIKYYVEQPEVSIIRTLFHSFWRWELIKFMFLLWNSD